MHADGVMKLPRSFEHIPPETVGNERRFPCPEISGKAAVSVKSRRSVPDLLRIPPETGRIVKKLKDLENEGYQFDGADSSFELLIRKIRALTAPFSN